MEKIKVFFSYQWSTGDSLRAAVISFLEKLENVEVFVDKNVIQPSDIIHDRISENLDACDCIIASTKSFDSLEVISELIRADERKKKIYILRQRNDDASMPGFLYFLKDKLQVVYTDIDDLSYKLTKLFEGKTREEFEILSPDLREIQKAVDLQSLPRFKGRLIKDILREASREIKQLKGKDYSIDVGAEKNFLIRARSIFENAEEIYAVSMDSVSTFWTDRRNRKLAESYIKSQPNNTVRLFVFSSPRVANQYRYILQANHNSYGLDGRVLLCSFHTYRNLIKKFGSASEVDTYMSKDFGVLVYEGDSKVSGTNKRSLIEAFLDHSELSFKNIDASRLSKFDYHGLLKYFQELSRLDFHEISEEEGVKGEKIIIKRWNPRCVTDNYLWRDELKKIFPEERYGDVYHFVFFKQYDNALEAKIREVKNTLSRDKEAMRIKSIWFGKKTDGSPVADFQYGSLKVGDDYEYVLMMNFSSYEDLRIYYSDRRHSDLRTNLYKHLDKSLELLYGYLDEVKRKNPQKGAEIFESTIEGIVSNYMSRHDFVDKEDIDSISLESPYRFPFEYDS
ncbi:Dabb family protein [Nodosilinea sp. PGN35]|uniref:Dabb family protein n=1 Tax=Nodosilinea sp. PGN35 TaxID=3020489 RepID=UPI0023B22B74|nr:Dabb family protein [Nodosilinea sp. TSF1-S3]MDF0366881.1 Dabb family protein [Nodosilinea sp. TSF1-S3]